MFVSSTGSVSIYRVIREVLVSDSGLSVSAVTLQALIAGLFDLLIEQQLAVTIFVKLPHNSSWEAEIERYQQQIKTATIYLCSDRQSAVKKIPTVIPLRLVTSSELQRESFLIVLGSQLCAAIATQQQEQLQVVCSFEPNVLSQVLAKLKNAIAPTDSTPEIPETFSLPDAVAPDLLSNLVRKHLQRSDELTKRQPWQFKDAFIFDVVEEFSTPLTHMKTALSILKSNQLSERQRDRYLQLLNQECDRQHGLIEAMRTLVQLDSLSPSQNQEKVQLADLVPGIVSTYQPLAMERGIQLGYTVPANLPPVSCPHHWLRQIIINLLNNSLKFTPDGGKVSVRASYQEKYVKLTFRDTGVGIAEEEIPKIFDSFYRGSIAKNNEDTVGVGLGLTIARQLLLRCHGSISVTSKLGVGSVFTILLPVRE
ncbi:MAG: ATP-binding protein [Oscillatoria sp. PMC 1051.18]|nr:ATP-binding protein [Oscillatoria sp. PMC 1050.18]MEC5030015.1 ATP-binding protein [Oscillatoria sp. PMC 1051.18]